MKVFLSIVSMLMVLLGSGWLSSPRLCSGRGASSPTQLACTWVGATVGSSSATRRFSGSAGQRVRRQPVALSWAAARSSPVW